MPYYGAFPVVTPSALTAAKAYNAWALELGVSTTATLAALDVNSAAVTFQLDSAAMVAGSTYAEFSSEGAIGWSKVTKAGISAQTDFTHFIWSGNVQPDMFIGLRVENRDTGSSGVKLQKAGGYTILTGRYTASSVPVGYGAYFDFAIKFSPNLAVYPVLVITNFAYECQVSYCRVNPAIPDAKFSSRRIPYGSWSITPEYRIIGGLLDNAMRAVINRPFIFPLPRTYNGRVVNAKDNTRSGPLRLTLPLNPTLAPIKGRGMIGGIGAKDVLFGGAGEVEGFVTVDGVVSGRRVTLYDKGTKFPLRSQVSKPNGKYRFEGLDKSRRYFVIGDDNEEIRESVIRDRITFENGVEVQDIPAFITGTFGAVTTAVYFSFAPGLTVDKPGAVWSISSGALPAGLSINAASGMITGTTSVSSSLAFVLKADWGAAYAIQPISPLIIEVIPQPSVMSAGLRAGLIDYISFNGSGVNSIGSGRDVINEPVVIGTDFNGAAGGWTFNGTVSHTSNSMIVSAETIDSNLVSPSLFLDGAKLRYIHMRFKRNAGTAWDGSIFYATPNHYYTSSYVKGIEDLTVGAPGGYVTVVADMGSLSSGGSDWITSMITSVRIDLGNTSADVFEIDYICFSDNPDSVIPDYAYKDSGVSGKEVVMNELGYMSLPAAVNTAGTQTISMWCSGTGGIYSSGADIVGQGWNMLILDTAALVAAAVVTMIPSPAGYGIEVPHGIAATTTRRHYLIEFDNTAQTLRLTVNNSAVATAVTSTGTDLRAPGYAPVAIGAAVNTGTAVNLRNGTIDEFAKWNRILTTAEKAALYNAGLGSVF